MRTCRDKSSVGSIDHIPSASACKSRIISRFFNFVRFLLARFRLKICDYFAGRRIIYIVFKVLYIFDAAALHSDRRFILTACRRHNLRICIAHERYQLLVRGGGCKGDIPRISALKRIALPATVIVVLVVIRRNYVVGAGIGRDVFVDICRIGGSTGPRSIVTLLRRGILGNGMFITICRHSL